MLMRCARLPRRVRARCLRVLRVVRVDCGHEGIPRVEAFALVVALCESRQRSAILYSMQRATDRRAHGGGRHVWQAANILRVGGHSMLWTPSI